MNKWLIATIVVVGTLVIGGAYALGVGEDAKDAIVEAQTVEPVTNEPLDEQTTTVEVDEHADDDRMIERYVNAAPGSLAKMCQASEVIGREQGEQMGRKILGGQILKQGGDVTYVVDGIYDAC